MSIFKKAGMAAAFCAGLMVSSTAFAGVLVNFDFTDGNNSSANSVVKSQSGVTITVTAQKYHENKTLDEVNTPSNWKVWKDKAPNPSDPTGYGVCRNDSPNNNGHCEDNDDLDGTGGNSRNGEMLVIDIDAPSGAIIRVVSATFVDGDHHFNFSNGNSDRVDVFLDGSAWTNDMKLPDGTGLVMINQTGVSQVGFGASENDDTFYLASVTLEILKRPSVPEPGILGLMGLGLAGMGLMRRRQKAQK